MGEGYRTGPSGAEAGLTAGEATRAIGGTPPIAKHHLRPPKPGYARRRRLRREGSACGTRNRWAATT
ncbi:MAG TPA: hypothetical protein VNO35_26335, partial [Steroidobacteraceae bacterium]|nr:hypothetical protein [Steroidobacteraceae bacterium]